MEYIYAVMLLNKAGKEVNESNLKKVLEAAGVKADEVKIKSIVAAIEGINIEEVIKENLAASVAAPAAGGSGAAVEEKKEEAKEEKKENKASEEESAAGLGALFG